jgi:phage terminase large subunit
MLTTQTQTPPQSSALTRYAQAARRAGVPRDQLERFIRGGYVAQPHQLAWHAAARRADRDDGPAMIGIGGRRGPGKTHATFAQVALDDCQRTDGLKMLFLRKVLKAAKESFEDVRRKVLYATPHEYKVQSGIIEFPNGSRIVLGHFKHESDIDNYLGIEYDGAAIEEFTQLGKAKVEMLRGSIRTTRRDWRPRLYATTNPGGVGHQYFRQTFVLPWREGKEAETCFLPASADENRYLDAGYKKWLAGLSGTLGRMWRDGDWDVAGGAFFTNWNYDRVVCDPFPIPAHWRLHLAMDYGFQHWNIIYLLGRNDDGTTFFLDELALRHSLVPQIAQSLAAMLARHGVEHHRIGTFVAGHDCFSKESSGRAIADSWQDAGWALEVANVDRKAGAAEWLRRLGNDAAGVPVTVQITKHCPRLIETLPMLLSNPHDPEDVLKVDCDEDGDGGDDPYDGSRYGLMVDGGGPQTAPAVRGSRPLVQAMQRGLRR